MKVALIWPKGFRTKAVIPLSLGYLKSNIDNTRHDVKIFDYSLNNVDSNSSSLQEMIKKFNPKIIGISCWSITYKEAIRILKKIKSINKNIITVIGGIHATVNSDEVIKNKDIDFLFRGEAEISFSKFIDEMQKEKPDLSKIEGLTYCSSKNDDIVNNKIIWGKNLDKIKIPDYDAINLEGYLKTGYKYASQDRRNAPIRVTRGCPYSCDFCSASIQNGKIVRHHSVEYIIKWIKFLYYNKKIKTINIIDDNFTFYSEYAKDVCKAIIKLNLKDLHMGTPNGIRMECVDKELLKLMKRAGWEYLVVAPESGSIKTLKRMNKKLDLEIVPEKVKEIKDAGFKITGYFMVGYPGESQKDIKDTVKLIRKCKFDFFHLFNFQPLPGTPVYDRLVKRGEISSDFLPKEYSSGNIVYTPKKLKDFNFPLLRLREYLYLAVTNPSSIPYALKYFSHKTIITKIFSNSINVLKNIFK